MREYRKTTSSPSVEVAAIERPNSADWFDLRVKVSIDGEVIPFEDLFVALTEGQDFLILETGVYFSLDRPEFVQLRELIEESKVLHDHHRPELSIQPIPGQLVGGPDQPRRRHRSVGSLGSRPYADSPDVSTIDDVDVPETLGATPGPTS